MHQQIVSSSTEWSNVFMEPLVIQNLYTNNVSLDLHPCLFVFTSLHCALIEFTLIKALLYTV
jgi:hypothetical protein